MKDFRYALRMLAANPGFTVVAVLALALGIGANTAIFSVIDAVLLRPLPYPNPEQLVWIGNHYSEGALSFTAPLSAVEVIEFRDRQEVFRQVSVIRHANFNLSSESDAERLQGVYVSAPYFDMLGVTPMLGRGFRQEEDRPGANSVVVLNHSLWKRRFGSDRQIVGRGIILDGQSYEVIGVTPEWFGMADTAE